MIFLLKYFDTDYEVRDQQPTIEFDTHTVHCTEGMPLPASNRPDHLHSSTN